MTAATLDETAAQVLTWLASVRPLRGCAYVDEGEGAELGRRVADRIAWDLQLKGRASDLTPAECCNLLRWLHWCEPLEGATFMGEPVNPETALVGMHILIGTVESALRKHLGIEAAEEVDDDQEVDDAA